MPGLAKFVLYSSSLHLLNRNDSMGKCVSKQTSATAFIAATEFTGNGDTKRFSSGSTYIPFFNQEDDINTNEAVVRNGSYRTNKSRKYDFDFITKGQSESKKSSKRAQAHETKGTAMSFGFRKKLHSSNKKASMLNNQEKQKEINDVNSTEKYHSATVISNPGLVETEVLKTPNPVISDKNGNAGTDSANSERDESKRPTLRTAPLRRDASGVGNVTQKPPTRFGFKSSNVVRPTSAGPTPKLTEFDESVENNNVIEKRRSKSACSSGTNRIHATSDKQQSDEHQSSVPKINSTTTSPTKSSIQEKPRHRQEEKRISFVTDTSSQTNSSSRSANQYTVINTGMHTNVVVKPAPQPATSVTRFTLHTTSLPKPQYPVPISLSSTSTARTIMDMKNAKQAANNCRKGGFQGPREVSTDSGIASLDNNYDNNFGAASSRRGSNNSTNGAIARNRPRNLEMVISGRHKFEVRDVEDSLSCDSVEPLVLPKLPSVFSSNNQTVSLNGLIRANLLQNQIDDNEERNARTAGFAKVSRAPLSDSESIDEEKLFRDRSTSEKETKNPSIKDYNLSSKNSSPGSSRASWCNAGESLAIKDCSSLSLSSSEDSKDNQNEKTANDVQDVAISSITLSENPSMISSFTATLPKSFENPVIKEEQEHSREKLSNIAESKFAEMAANVPDVLLDDETSPTDSLVSSSESDDAVLKKHKKKSSANTAHAEKEIDEISPELDLCSPTSLGTPTHASNSFSLSDGGRDFLIDDEIADQPGLLFNDKNDLLESTHLQHSFAGTPTLIESMSTRSSMLQLSNPQPLQTSHTQHRSKGFGTPSKEFSLKTPIARKRISLLSRAESLDTLSPCESIASDDLMMDFESSSMDSIDRLTHSIRSRAGSVALHEMDDEQLRSELETRSGEVIREWNNILRVHKTNKDSILSQLPARATRLLNRSRLQQNQFSNAGSESPRSTDSLSRKPSRASSLHFGGRDPNSSSDDLFFHDKSFRNSMIQDVLYFKKQLVRLRRILQEQHQDEENLTRTETLNPFELGNGQFFGSCGLDSDKELCGNSLTTSTSTLDEQRQELADLRRQVVYLQGQVDDRDRTIRLQKHLIDKLEAERDKIQTVSVSTSISEKECVNSATQTERIRPLSIGHEGLARSKTDSPCYNSYSTSRQHVTETPIRKTSAISNSFSNIEQITQMTHRFASLGWEKFHCKATKQPAVHADIPSLYNNNCNKTHCNGENGDVHKNNFNNSILNNNNNEESSHTKNGISSLQHNNNNGITSLKYVKLKSPARLINGVQLNNMKESEKYYSRNLSTINSIHHSPNNNSNKSFDEVNGDHLSQTITIV